MAAGGSGSIAKELFEAIKLRDYREYINKLNKADIMTPKEFAESIYAQNYVLDTRICYHGRRINKDHVYDIFSDFSSTDAETAKMEMMNEITDNYDWYESRGRVVLNMDGLDLALWLNRHLKSNTVRADELALYALSHLYNRHTVVFGKNRPWCTIRPTGDPKEADFVNSCHVHLLYIGVNMFAPLKPRVDDVPQYVVDYTNAGTANWARVSEANYAAYYKEEDYSDYVEVIGEKRKQSSSEHPCKHRAATSTVTAATLDPVGITGTTDTLTANISYSGQPVFPGEDVYSITYHFDAPPTTSSNIEHIVTISNSASMKPHTASQNVQLGSSQPRQVPKTALKEPITDADVVEIWDDQTKDTLSVKQVTAKSVQKVVNWKDPGIALDHDEVQIMPDLQQMRVTTDPAHKEETSAENDQIDPSPGKQYMLEHNRKCFVKISRLDQATLDKYKPPIPIDTETEELTVHTDIETESLNYDDGSSMSLRPRKKATTGRPCRSTAKSVDYTNMDVESDVPEEPVKPRKKCRPLSGPSKDRIRAQRMVTRQTHPATSSSNTDETDQTETDISNKPVKQETDTAEEAYQGDIEDNEPKPRLKPKGKLVTKVHGVKKRPKKVRKFRCKICDNIFNSTKEWNQHYEASHPPISCADCSKQFRNPTSLYRHRYVHTKVEGVHPCEKCDRIFPFESQLTSHMYTHRKVSHFPCTYDGCKKVFKTEWNRRAHEKSHENEEMQCPHCVYVTRDERYMKQHSRVHEDTFKYYCEVCNKGFKFYEQKKRHVLKTCRPTTNN